MSLRDLVQAETALAVTQYRITVNAQGRTPNLTTLQTCPPHTCLDSLHDGLLFNLSNRPNNDDHRSAKRASGVNVLPQAEELDAKMVQFV